MTLAVEINEADLRKLVAAHIAEKTGQEISPANVRIEVKSTQNYRAEWEPAAFRAKYLSEV